MTSFLHQIQSLVSSITAPNHLRFGKLLGLRCSVPVAYRLTAERCSASNDCGG